ncbi:DNA-binding SARP family transcriptional activator [Halopolyspora algeriensis]|uniref:DNA-binding SARP family transcriptional activator n=1 Tax=Halopolyspora algeriensis TaxID=1500506 RepID=A0A368VRQ8_9ACTN|nr:DNA-binding SARP family transcriptional activator [Halopolyspora algeriensis]TQM46411.1 DNA-binding SARP family transcriptional activator [Halopolyspora algeriensis]
MAGAPSTGFEFRVLGPLEVLHCGVCRQLGHSGMRSVLACLLFEPNQAVSMDRLIDTLWAETPPATARTIIHGHISKLRKLFTAAPVTEGEDVPAIITRAPGYLLTVSSDRIDAHRARALIDHARGLEPPERSRVLSEALALWRGPALADIASDRLRRTIAANLDELRLFALEERIAADLELGYHQHLVTELSGLVDEYPLRERLTGLLILAHHRSGQRAQAQARYHALRERLSDEFGIDPGPELRSLYERMLRDDETLLAHHRESVTTTSAGDGGAHQVPAELPPAVAGFVGRERELAALDRILADREQGTANLLTVLTGPAGVGKSALAVVWAHRIAHTFPDGRLHASLRGFDSERAPLSPGEVLAGFLKALGVAADAIPVDLDERAALYRSLLADRRVLVLLDDARDTDQVRPLLPGSPGSLVVVTSRRRLDGLVVRSGARMLPLETLPASAAVELLDRAGVPGRSASEPVAARRLADLCGGLPLALRIAAARLAAGPGRSVAELVCELTDERNRLHGLDIDDPDTSVRRAFDLSYRNLHPAHATMFRLLGVMPGHTFTPHTVAALCGTDPDTARHRLRALALAHLVTESEPDRFGMHDLLRLYARELLAACAGTQDVSDAHCAETALRRLLHHYLVVADHARRFLRPARDELDYSGDGTTVRPYITDRTEALEWFDAEWPNLVAAIRAAHAEGLHEYAWPLVRLQFNYLMVRCPWEDWITVYSTGMASAGKLDDPAGKVLMSAGLGVAYARSGNPAMALEHYTSSHEGAVAAGRPSWLAMTQVNMGSALFRLGRYGEARRHCEEALETYRELGDRYREAGALNNLAQVEQVSGEREAALAHLREAEAMYREADDLEVLAMVLNNCGEVSTELGRVAEAERYHHEALEVAQRCGSAMRQAAANLGLGDAAALREDRAVARTRWETALAIFRAGGSPRAEDARTRLNALPHGHRAGLPPGAEGCTAGSGHSA